ncbi:MAG TPA: hypothetical protein VEK15_30350, partial [Vicinamibacteria bacterium]|nr:hypothetical protein [Vicinamibacteria bacterium]
AHSFMVIPRPGDHSLESATLLNPLMSDVDEGLIVRHQNAAELNRFFEVHGIWSSLGKRIDSSDNVLAGSPESLYASS